MLAPILEQRFAELLRVTPEFLAQRRMDGSLRSDHRTSGHPHAPHLYAITTVDGYLKDWMSSTKEEMEPPTYQKILEYLQNTQDTEINYFLTAAEVATMLQCEVSMVRRYIHNGDLGALLLPSTGRNVQRIPRIPRPWVMEYILTHTIDQAVSYDVVSKILGVHRAGLGKLVGPGRPLRAATVLGGGKEAYITTASVKAYLSEPGRLVNCTPDEWWGLREAYHFEALFSRDSAARRYHVSKEVIQALVDDGVLPCIFTGTLDQQRQMRLPLHALQEWDEGRQLIATHAVHMLGIPIALARHWMRLHLLCDAQHPEGDVCPRRSCFRRYIMLHQFGKAFTPSTWATAMSKTAPVMDDQILAQLPHFSAERLVVAAEDGRLSGIWLPAFKGRRRFIVTASSAEAFVAQESC